MEAFVVKFAPQTCLTQEVFGLMHGTVTDNVPVILEHDFNERIANLASMYCFDIESTEGVQSTSACIGNNLHHAALKVILSGETDIRSQFCVLEGCGDCCCKDCKPLNTCMGCKGNSRHSGKV